MTALNSTTRFRPWHRLLFGFHLVLLSGSSGFAQDRALDSDLLRNAALARQKSQLAIDDIKTQFGQQTKDKYSLQTTQQIRKQIDLANELGDTMSRTRRDRENRITKMKEEVDQLLLQIKQLNSYKKAPQFRPNPASSKTISSANISDSKNPGIAAPSKNKTAPEKQGAPIPSTKGSNPPAKLDHLNGKDDSRKFQTMDRDPVNKLGLANNLVAIGSHGTAVRIYLEILEEKQFANSERNWIHLQLGLCYWKLGSMPEAEKNLRDAANSEQPDVARETAIWWLDQMKEKKRIANSLTEMQEKIEQIRGTNEPAK